MVEDSAERVERGKKVKKEVEKDMEKMDDSNDVSTLGTFKSDEGLRSFIRRKKSKKP